MKIFSLCADCQPFDKLKNKYKNHIFIIDPEAIYLCNWISYLAENSITTYKKPFTTIPSLFKNYLIKKIRESDKNEIDSNSILAIEKLLAFLNTYCSPEKIVYLRIYYDI